MNHLHQRVSVIGSLAASPLLLSAPRIAAVGPSPQARKNCVSNIARFQNRSVATRCQRLKHPLARPRGMRKKSPGFIYHAGNGFQVSRRAFSLSRSPAILPSVPVAFRCPASFAAVHSASRAALHRWRLASRSLPRFGKAARGLFQPRRLHGVVRLNFHFPCPLHGGEHCQQSLLGHPYPSRPRAALSVFSLIGRVRVRIEGKTYPEGPVAA